ncbi:type III pantothenate kinase [Anaerohalosphaeraceae bacterium U12dextr]|jgi:type III pantothenate kinase
MNIIAIDIGNTNIKVALFLNDTEQYLKAISGNDQDVKQQLASLLRESWNQIPLVPSAAIPVRDGVVVVSSVKPVWTQLVEDTVKETLSERIYLIGRDIPLPIETNVENPQEVGTDRLVTAAAAFAVVEDAVVVADFGTAITIDLVDDNGVFMGGIIAPGMAMGANALHTATAKLPQVDVIRPDSVYGTNTRKAITAGLFYAAAGLLETMTRKYAEELGKWPHVIVTGNAASILKDECEFVDSWVPELAVRGIVIAYKKHIYEKEHIDELDAEDRKGR